MSVKEPALIDLDIVNADVRVAVFLTCNELVQKVLLDGYFPLVAIGTRERLAFVENPLQISFADFIVVGEVEVSFFLGKTLIDI